MDPTSIPHRTVPTGWGGVDDGLGISQRAGTGEDLPLGSGLGPSRGLVRGAVHEWFGVSSAGEAPGAGPPGWSPPLFLLTHLAGRAVMDAVERGAPDHVVWIGRSVWPYPRALSHPVEVALVGQVQHRPNLAAAVTLIDGSGPALQAETQPRTQARTQPRTQADLLARSLFVAPEGGARRASKVKEVSERLWAIDTALRCPGVTAVVADGSGLTMAATRRLQLAAASTGVLVLLARPPAEVREISAATTRWTVKRAAQDVAHVPSSPQAPDLLWNLTLLRAKGAQRVLSIDPQVTPRNHHAKPHLILTEPEAAGRRRNQPSIQRFVHSHAARP